MVLIQLKIKTIDGKDASVLIDDEETIGELRNRIQNLIQISPENQRLIFRGHILSDDSLKIKESGLEDNMAIHIVLKPPPLNVADMDSNLRTEEQQPSTHDINAHMHAPAPHIVTQNLIIGHVPLERTSIFQEPGQTLMVVGNVIEQLRNRYHMEAEHSLRLNQPQNNDFSIYITLRGNRNQIVNSPAYERFNALRLGVKKLAWLVSLIQAKFLDALDSLLIGEIPDHTTAYWNIAHVLNFMHDYDHFLEQHFSDFITGHNDPELSALITQLTEWNLAEDEDHIEQLNQYVTMRHCTTSDLSTLLMILSIIDAKINEHLLSRYHRTLSLQQNFQSNSYSARFLNCFANAVSRVQHLRAHIYHNISDLSLHFDNNEHSRLYPQYASYRRVDEPPQAEISLMFFNPHSLIPHPHSGQENTQTQQAPRSGTRSLFQSMFNGLARLTQPLVIGNSNRNINTALTSSSNIPHIIPSHQNSSSNVSTGERTAPSMPLQSLPVMPYIAQQGIFSRLNTRMGNPLLNQPTNNPFISQISEFNWRRISPEAPQVMFVGPNPPAQLPLLTIDPFLTCSSRRYRVFEIDARHNNFWNDPETIALGINPPPNSISASQRGYPSNQGQQMDADLRLADVAGTVRRNFIPDDDIRSIINENLSMQPQANNHGEAIFTEMEQFTQFIHQTLETVAHCMAHYDENILSQPFSIQQGFTASSRVGGFIPSMMIPNSNNFLQESEPIHQAVITMSFEPRESGQQQTSRGNLQFGSPNNGE